MTSLYDPAQVQTLIDTCNRLEGKLELHRLELVKTGKTARRGRRIAILGIFIGLMSAFGIYKAFAATDDVDHLVRANARENAEARVSSCIQFNAQREEIRVAFKTSLLALAPNGAALTPDQQQVVLLYAAAVDKGLPYRDCSPEGIALYFSSPPKDPATR